MNFDEINDLSDLIPRLDEKRKSLNLSYQNVADSCNVSQRTIMRFFKQEGDPSYALVQQVISALQYDFVRNPIIDTDPTAEDHVLYLRSVIDFERKDKKIRLDQQEARHNRRINEERRIRRSWQIVAIALIVLFVLLFLYDFAHADRGWIQEYLKYSGVISQAYMTACNWMREVLWSA